MNIALYIAGFLALGLLGGILSGLLGIGGGILIVPALVFIAGMTQHKAQGTTLALMVPPIGLLAAWTYWKQGYVDVKVAILICLGFFFGGLIGAKLAGVINAAMLKKLFGVLLLVTAFKMILSK
ncbi:MAG: TSUP family transporter [Phycisphaerales bacterium]